MGATNHQSAIIAHTDTAHPHVHVLVNRVDPERGKLLDLWNYQKKLSKWVLAYERSRGRVLCDQRAENWKKREAGQIVNADKGMTWQEHDQAQALGHANDNDTAQILADQKAKDARLAAFGEKQASRHNAEWQAYSRDYQGGKSQINDKQRGATAFQRARADVLDQFKPLRSQRGQQQWRGTKDFEWKERRVAGKLENALAAVRHARLSDPDSSRGFMAIVFNFLTNKKARADALDRLHRAQWRNLYAAQNAQVGATITKIEADQQAAFKDFRARFPSRRQMLKDPQDAERATLQWKWASRKQERRGAFELIRAGQSLKEQAKAAPEASRGEARAEFNRAARGQRKRRSRSRKRDLD